MKWMMWICEAWREFWGETQVWTWHLALGIVNDNDYDGFVYRL
jgi:hypothetical protein